MSVVQQTPLATSSTRRVTKRRAASPVPNGKSITYAPYAKRKRSRLFSLEHAYQGSPETVKAPKGLVFSPLRLGNLPIPRLNFNDSDCSEDEDDSGFSGEQNGSPVVSTPETNNNQQQASSKDETPKRFILRSGRVLQPFGSIETPKLMPRKRWFEKSSALTPLATSKSPLISSKRRPGAPYRTAQEKVGLKLRHVRQRSLVQHAPNVQVVQNAENPQTPKSRVRDITELFKVM